MKDFCIKSWEQFLKVADTIDTPFKFYEKDGNELRAEIWLRTALVSWEGEATRDKEDALVSHGFSEAELRETKRPLILDEI